MSCQNGCCNKRATHVERGVATPRAFCSKVCQISCFLQQQQLLGNRFALIAGGGKREREEEPAGKKHMNNPEDPISYEPLEALDASRHFEMDVGKGDAAITWTWDLDSLMRAFSNKLPFARGTTEVATNPMSRDELTPDEIQRLIRAAEYRRTVLHHLLDQHAERNELDAFKEALETLKAPYGFVVTRAWIQTKAYAPAFMALLEAAVPAPAPAAARTVGEDSNLFIHAARTGNTALVEQLLHASNAIFFLYHNMALRSAAQNGHAEIVQLLLDAHDTRIDPSALEDEAIVEAAARGHLEVVRTLLNHPGTRFAPNGGRVIRANPSARGNAAISLAARNGHVDVVRLLLEVHDRGIDPSVNRNAVVAFVAQKIFQLSRDGADWIMGTAERLERLERYLAIFEALARDGRANPLAITVGQANVPQILAILRKYGYSH